MSTSYALITPDPELDAQRRRALRRMRSVAVGLLVLAAVVYVATIGQDGWLGYVNAGAEASMVGAMADWFAVTALFKRPLGLPIPHTALVPRRKDELGRSLQDFVGENFLQEQVIRDRIAAATVAQRLATWAVDERHAARVVAEITDVAGVALEKVRDEHVAEVVELAVLPRFREEPVAPLAGALLTEVLRDGAHTGVVDLAVEELRDWLERHPDTFAEVLVERAPWWSPPRLNEAVTTRVHGEALRWLDDIRADPHHRARQAFDSMLAQLAEELLHDPATQERAERLKHRVLDQPQVVATAVSLWQAFRRSLVGALAETDGPLRRRGEEELTRFARKVLDDQALRDRLDGLLADAVVFAVRRYGSEVTTIISATIERWDGREASRKIELHVGRDLQFIRINGTIVGGLVGVVIHALSALV